MLVQADSPSLIADRILSLTEAKNLVIFVGAFVSNRSPSLLPMALSLKSSIAKGVYLACEELLYPSVDSSVLFSDQSSRFKDVPLELIAEEVVRKTGVSISQLFGWLSKRDANTNHRVLAMMSDIGLATIVTTNFDELIEKITFYPSRIIKLHGTVSSPETMIAKLSQVGQGSVSKNFKRLLKKVLNYKSVCFIGYAGRDMDILPILREIKLKQVIWITRPSNSDDDKLEVEADLKHLSFLEKTAEILSYYSVDANSIFDSLASKLGVRHISAGTTSNWEQEINNTFHTLPKIAATIAFARILGASGLWKQAKICYENTKIPIRKKDKYFWITQLYYAEANYWLGEYHSAKTLSSSAARAFASKGQNLEQAKAFQLLGLIASRSTSPRMQAWAPRYMRRVTQLTDLCNSPEAISVSINNYLNLGIWLKNKSRLVEAFNLLREALKQALRIGDIRIQQKVHHALGIVFRRKRQIELFAGEQNKNAFFARLHLKKAATLANFLGLTNEEVRILSTRVNLELDGIGRTRGAIFRAKHYLEKISVLIERSHEPEQAGRFLELKALVLAAEGQFVKSETLFTEALAKVQTNIAKVSCLQGRASSRIEIGLNKLAIDDLTAAMHILPSGIDKKQLFAIYRKACKRIKQEEAKNLQKETSIFIKRS